MGAWIGGTVKVENLRFNKQRDFDVGEKSRMVPKLALIRRSDNYELEVYIQRLK